MLDANENMDNVSGLSDVSKSCDIVDSHSFFSGEDTPNYSHIDNKIVYILVSSPLIESGTITQCIETAIHQSIVSDHVGLWIDFHEDRLLLTRICEALACSFH